MDTTGTSSLFELTFDQESIAHLTETARWGKFLAIAGFVGCGLLVVLAFVIGAVFASLPFWQATPGGGTAAAAIAPIGGALLGAMYLVFGAAYFFPCLFLYRFSVRMRMALKTRDQVQLNQSLRAQKYLFRYVGILTIIALALGGIELLVFGVLALVGLGAR
jgi:hypothetical protein